MSVCKTPNAVTCSVKRNIYELSKRLEVAEKIIRSDEKLDSLYEVEKSKLNEKKKGQ